MGSSSVMMLVLLSIDSQSRLMVCEGCLRVYEGSARLSAVFKRVYEAYESYLSQPSLRMGDRKVARMACARLCEAVCGMCV